MLPIERVKKILLQPAQEWQVIRGEQTATADLFKGYVLPLAAISAVAGFIGYCLIGVSVPFLGTYRMPFLNGVGMAVSSVVLALASVYAIAYLINALAPRFGAQPDMAQALKVAAYSYTPAWVAGVLQILPSLGMLVVLASFYGLYLLYLGLQALMQAPREKALPYTAVVVVCAVVLSLIIGAIMAATGGGPGAAVGSMSPAATGRPDDERLAKMKEFGEKMEAAGRKLEEAQKSGDPQAQAKAAGEALGALAGATGGRPPVDHRELKALLPESLDGLPRTQAESQTAGLGGASMARAEARYGEGERSLQLSITDSGGAKALMAMAGFALMESEKESADGYEKSGKADGRVYRERLSKSAREASYALIVGDRFMVEAEGHGLDMAAVKQALAKVDLARLEGMKDK